MATQTDLGAVGSLWRYPVKSLINAMGWIGSGLILTGVLAVTIASTVPRHDPLQP